MLDHEGYLSLFRREQSVDESWLSEGKRIFRSSGASGYDSAHRVTRKESGLLQLNTKTAGASGRRKIGWVDWDGDGHLDLLVNSRNVDWLRGKPGSDGSYQLEPQGPLATTQLAGHTTSPTTVDWNRDGIPDLLVGAEDGFLYYLENPRTAPTGVEQ